MAKTILIVEDNPLNRQLMGDLLEAGRYRTLRAADGETGLALARRHRPDAVLMDIRLPGMSGLDVTRRLKDDLTLRHIPVLAVTALAMTEDIRRIADAGCDGSIEKPFSAEVLLEAVARITGRGGRRKKPGKPT